MSVKVRHGESIASCKVVPDSETLNLGIIMGPATTFHMLLGAIAGWGILSPLAKNKGWAPGDVHKWESGSKGWIVWVSLAIMLADSVISLGWLILQPILLHGPRYVADFREHVRKGSLLSLGRFGNAKSDGYAPLSTSASSAPLDNRNLATNEEADSCQESKDLPEADAPASHLVSNRVVAILAVLSIVVCILSIHVVFGALIPFYAILLAILLALLLSLMGVRALGETDLNPVSGISKLTQLFFALIIPASNPNAVTINLLAGAISESGALQAGDMMQDLKTGHLMGAAPKAQFYGQMIGSLFGAIISAWVYQLYTTVYDVPGGLFQVPTAYVWIFTARLVTGKGLPPMASQWALGAGILFAGATVLRIMGHGKRWHAWVPGGIAVAVGKRISSNLGLLADLTGFRNVQCAFLHSCPHGGRDCQLVLAHLPWAGGNPCHRPGQRSHSGRRDGEHPESGPCKPQGSPSLRNVCLSTINGPGASK